MTDTRARFVRAAALLAGVSFCLLGPVVRADERPGAKPAGVKQPFLWEVQGPSSTSYLFGTIHLPDPRVTNMPDVVNRAREKVDALYTEIPMDPMVQFRAQAALIRTDGSTLHDVIPAEVYKRADAILQKHGLSLAPFDSMNTMIAATMVSIADMLPKMGLNPALDMILYNEAQAAGKEVGGVETPEEQIAVFMETPEADQVKFFTKTVELVEKAQRAGRMPSSELLDAYLTGDAKEIDRVMYEYLDLNDPGEKKLFERLLTNRNKLMAERVDKLMKDHPQKSYFFAFGAAHMPGDEGVVKLLQQRGYKIRPLRLQDAGQIK